MVVRRSRQREAILEIIKRTGEHPTAEMIHVEARKKIPSISLGTVYRNLRILARKNEILELNINNNPSRFDGNTQYHPHFLCEQCDRILEFAFGKELERIIIQGIIKDTGLKITYHRCELIGICQDCQI